MPRPPSQIPNARRGGRGYAFASPADLPLHHRPNPTVPRGDPGHLVLRHAQGFAVAPAGGARFRHRGSSPCQARHPGMRCLIRPALGVTDRRDVSEDCRGAATVGFARGGLQKEPANDRRCRHRRGVAFGRVKGGLRSPRGVRPPSCGLRRRVEPHGRHGAAWRASPRCCGRLPPRRASYHRRRKGCRSRLGATR